MSRADARARVVSAVASTLALTALTVWIGGLLALGAVVAPIVFHAIPFNMAADTMAVVFARYDKLAMGAAAVVLATEAARGHLAATSRMTRAGLLRAVVSAVLALMAVVEGLWVTPTIARLHAEGAVRGVGEAGAALASAHGLAEQLGKGQALLAIVLIALHVVTLGERGDA